MKYVWGFKKTVILNHFLCLFNWHRGYLIRIDTGSSGNLLLRGHSWWRTSTILVLNCYCSFSFVPPSFAASPEGRAEERLQLSDNTDYITLHPVRVQVWVTYYRQVPAALCSGWRKEEMYRLLFGAAIIGVNITAVRQNAQKYDSKSKKRKWAHFPNTVCELLWWWGVVGYALFPMTDN